MKKGLVPKVSVCVIVYNHSNYILECLKSIAAQRCSFPFDVVIRDDASPDGSGDIIADFISENQLSNFALYRAEKNEGMMHNFLNTLQWCNADLIAICEGDDYWTDDLKLEKQFTLMDTYPGCAISIHPCYLHKSAIDKHIVGYFKGSEIKQFGAKDILENPGQFAPSASYMFRKEVVETLPSWFRSAPIGDFFIELFSLKLGYGLYLPEVMSAYRVFSQGSWTDEITKDRTGKKGVNTYRRLKIYLRKTTHLFLNHKECFNKRLGYLNYAIARQYIKRGDYKNFALYLNKAGNGICSMGFRVKVIYFLRNWKLLILALYKTKRFLSYVKNVFRTLL